MTLNCLSSIVSNVSHPVSHPVGHPVSLPVGHPVGRRSHPIIEYTMEIPQTIMSRFGSKQIKNEEITISRIRAAFGTETIPLSGIIVYHRGIDEEQRVVATALRIHAKEANSSFGGIIRVEILGGYAWQKRGTSYFVTERCNQLRKILTTNTSTFKKCTFVPIGGALFRLGEIEHLCDVPGLQPSALVETSTMKAYLKRKKYDEMKSPPTKMGRHADHVKRTLRGIVTQYYKHEKSTFKEESASDIQACLREIFAEFDVNVVHGGTSGAGGGFAPGFPPTYGVGYFTPVPAVATFLMPTDPVAPQPLSAARMLPVPKAQKVLKVQKVQKVLKVQEVQEVLPLPPCVRVVTPDNQETSVISSAGAENTGKLAQSYIGDILALSYIGDMNDFM